MNLFFLIYVGTFLKFILIMCSVYIKTICEEEWVSQNYRSQNRASPDPPLIRP